MYKVVYNDCYGGYSLSEKAIELYLKKKNVRYIREQNGDFVLLENENEIKEKNIPFYKKKNNFVLDYYEIPRHDRDLVEVVEELGKEANDDFSNLKIAEIYGNIYRIEEYDGLEEVIEPREYEWIGIN